VSYAPEILAVQRGDADPAEHERLARTWAPARGLLSWFAQTDHRTIGKRFIVTSFVWFALGGLLALAMRVQLAKPNNTFLSSDQYNQFFTVHGITMMFLFAVPVMLAVAVYVVPLAVGSRSLAFPRANAYAYYMFLFGGMLVYGALLLNMAPDTGWFAYFPLSGPTFAPGKRVDIWAQLVNFTEISALIVAVQLVVTILKQRAPGMSLNRMPLYVWTMLVTALMVIFAMPSVMLASNFMALDRLVGTHFFNTSEGGDVLLWQHLFWFFGHPEVYIIFVPALGFVSTIIAAFCRRSVVGYMAMVLSAVATGFIGFGLWVHHMFATGLPLSGQSFFTSASMMIAIPSGVQIFCWIATIWTGRPRFASPFLFVIGFVLIFVIGGLTGVMVAAIPIDLQVHDTFFVVAHLHYVLIGGSVFPLLGALIFWFPKMTGRMMSEKLGHLSFWLAFIGFNLTFFPMHNLGLMGMPRRVYTYVPETGWGRLNFLATIGAFVLGLGVLCFVVNALWSLRFGRPAGANPWEASTLEWYTSSPPPLYNFLHPPVVRSSEPLWEETPLPTVTGLSSDKREILITRVLDAEPDHRYTEPAPTVWPFVAALATAVMFVALIFTPWAFPIGLTIVFIFLVAWFWPTTPQKEGDAPPREDDRVTMAEATS
jgi:cytochrome c oxidase subunit I+III